MLNDDRGRLLLICIRYCVFLISCYYTFIEEKLMMTVVGLKKTLIAQ